MVKEHGLMQTKTRGVSHAMVAEPGSVCAWSRPNRAACLSSRTRPCYPGMGGITTQAAGRQTMAEITEYLVKIGEKLDDVRRAQKREVMARLDGVDLATREAVSVRA